ncbi:MAG: histidine kinase [Flavipsychrobacter sp.]|jgi:signal transduction histidine kinase|nr:histidine kinase [Flavipsychrobacter sp.]
MFRRYPYWGWLLVSQILWCMNGYYFHLHKKATMPESMASAVSSELNYQHDAFEDLIADQELIRHIFSDSLSPGEFNELKSQPFYVYAYERDSLKFWNTNSVIADINELAFEKEKLLRNDRGVFVEKDTHLKYLDSSKTLVALFPVVITYPIENNYLSSHFVASNNIPVNTKIALTDTRAQNEYPVSIGEQQPIFYLRFNPQDIPKWAPETLSIFLLLAALVASIWWVQLVIIRFTHNTSATAGFFATLAIILGLRCLLYIYGLPFNLDALRFFSPLLYSSSIYLSSLGDLFINAICILWLVIFITRHTPYRNYFNPAMNGTVRHTIAVILTTLLLGYVYLYLSIIRSLVVDSTISFDVSHFYSIDVFTLLGLLIICIITGISCLIIYLFNVQLNVLVRSKVTKYMLVALIGLALITVAGIVHHYGKHLMPFDWLFYWLLLVWLLIFIPLLDNKRFTLVSDLFEPHMIFWGVFICFFGTGVLYYYNQEKEREARIAYVNAHLMPKRDNPMEFAFEETAKKIQKDKKLKDFFEDPSLSARKTLNQYFDPQYLSRAAFNQYQAKLYLFDARERNLYNKDTTADFAALIEEKSESFSTNSSYLFYKENLHERHLYLSYIPIYSDVVNKIIGYVFIDFDLKKPVTQTVYPELLQPPSNNVSTRDDEYAHAEYVSNKIYSQTNDYPFSAYLDDDTLQKEQDYAFHRRNNNTELYYKVSDKSTIVIVRQHSLVIEMISLFSYLFVIEILLAIVILAYQLYFSYFSGKLGKEKFIRFTLRRRVHFSMLAVVLISFIIIGFVTIFFFSVQYKTSNNANYQSAMQLARQTIQGNLKMQRAFSDQNAFDSVSRSNSFKSFITTLANGQKIDINVFSKNGILLNTSEDEIYNKGLISNMMRADAYYQLNNIGRTILIQNENVAGLSYLSAYQPMRNERGTVYGFINVPFFTSEKELNYQISNIVVTLINLYAFIFLFSSVIAILITRWITKSFSIVIQQFGRINLQQNERITWPYDDEIGLLVSEYNKMVNKVEENAAMLAQSEREGAWREMARQVAHEIKNPLTPMKLNIQYLQQAMRNDSPNIKELTDKVSYSIIEQIDNLSYIASEFSNFAKMPEARAEELEIVALLHKATELYTNEENIQVTVKDGEEKIFVQSDRSQLLRVFTNLLENAKQAIQPGEAGKIDVSIVAQDGYALITITDNGAGIPDDIVKKMFQPYFTTKSSGTGLGLAMTKKIIEFWKGEIWFETKEGQGTTFYIKLPLIDPE